MRALLTLGKFLIGITLPILFMASAALASDGMRCGSKLILPGDIRDKVQALCGEPAEITHSSILRRPSYVRHGRVTYFGDQLTEIPVENWIYNFGPNKLMRRLRFVDGILEEIETLEYGYNSPNDK
jgi:hypothetical protein